MKTETIEFPKATVQITEIDNIVYSQVSGVFTDEVALRMVQRLDELIEKSADPLIRVVNAGGIPTGAFQLTSQCLAGLAGWAKRVQARKPGSVAYMVSPSTVSYGMARMYAQMADLETTGVIVVQSLNDLPAEIRQKLPV